MRLPSTTEDVLVNQCALEIVLLVCDLKQRKKSETASYSCDVIYLQIPLMFLSMSYKSWKPLILSFQHAAGWNHCLSHCIPSSASASGCNLHFKGGFFSPEPCFATSKALADFKIVTSFLPRKFSHEDNLDILDILGTDGAFAGLGNTSGLLLWWTKTLHMSSWLIAVLVSMHFAQILCQRTWNKFCHHLLKISPQFHQTQGLGSLHFQNDIVKKWEQKISVFY